MDGNNRWSKKKGYSKLQSYQKGAEKLLELTSYIFSHYNVNYISAFALSKNNTSRKNNFLALFSKTLRNTLSQLDFSHIQFKVNIIGDLKCFDFEIQKLLLNLENKTKGYKKKLNIFLNYSGRQEIVAAKLASPKGTHKNFESRLLTSDTPDPDILLRSGGYQRLSDFMLYQISFTDLFFTKKLWPDIKKKDIDLLINRYSKLTRKFGL